MWYRDHTLVQQRILDMRREAHDARVVSALLAGTPRNPGRHRSRARAASAAVIRRVGNAAIELSMRLDCSPVDAEGHPRRPEPALR
jgi:hypothetical protein